MYFLGAELKNFVLVAPYILLLLFYERPRAGLGQKISPGHFIHTGPLCM